MSDEKRMIGSYEVEHSIHLGDKEVILGVDKKEQYPFMVCYCTYDNPLGVPWAAEAVGTDDYLEAMQVFLDRVQAQVELSRAELAKYPFDKTLFTVKDCIPDDRNSSIVGKVVVINAEPKRYEYQHPAYQLVLADGGNGATGGKRAGGFWDLPCHRRALQMGKVRCPWGNQTRMYAPMGKGSPCQNQGTGEREKD